MTGVELARALAQVSKSTSLTRQLFIGTMVLSLVPLGLGLGLSFHRADKGLRAAADDLLSQTTDLEQRFLSRWFADRFRDLESQAGVLSNRHLLQGLEEARGHSGPSPSTFVGGPQWTKIANSAGAHLTRHMQTYSYNDVFLINRFGDILSSAARRKDLGTNLFSGPLGNTLFAQAT